MDLTEAEVIKKRWQEHTECEADRSSELLVSHSSSIIICTGLCMNSSYNLQVPLLIATQQPLVAQVSHMLWLTSPLGFSLACIFNFIAPSLSIPLVTLVIFIS